MRQLIKILVFLTAIILLAALDVSLFSAMTGFWAYINITLIMSLFLLVIINERIAFIVYLSSTALISITATSVDILPIFIGSLVLLSINWLSVRVFTNRSYYSLITLSLIGWYAYYLLFAICTLIIHLFNDAILLPQIGLSWILNIVFASIAAVIFLTGIYIFTTFTSNRLKSYFITSGM